MFGRDEKVSAIRLTAAQYIVLAIFLILTYGLWRLQVTQSDFYAGLAEKNKIRNVPILAPRGKILDREGRMVHTADQEIHAEVSGPGHLAAFDTGDLRDITPLQSDHRKLYQGHALAMIRVTGPGPVTLRISAPGLQSAQMTKTVK